MKALLLHLFLLGGLLLAAARPVAAQADQLAAVRSAIAGGSAHSLAQYLAPSVEVGFEGDKKSYNAAQAELVVKSFFARNQPTSFDIVHQGASNDGTPYAIGRYVSRGGTYRVFIELKPKRSQPSIDTLDFTKE